MSEITRFLFKKGVVDIILFLGQVDQAGYYELYKLGYVVSRQSFADILKGLEKRDLVHRDVLDTHPPRVNYSLTDKGHRIKSHLAAILEELE